MGDPDDDVTMEGTGVLDHFKRRARASTHPEETVARWTVFSALSVADLKEIRVYYASVSIRAGSFS